MLCNSWLTRLPIQEMVGRSRESALLRLMSWCLLWVLEVNESASEVRLRSESCCLFQWILMVRLKAPLDISDGFNELRLLIHHLIVFVLGWLQIGQVAIFLVDGDEFFGHGWLEHFAELLERQVPVVVFVDQFHHFGLVFL